MRQGDDMIQIDDAGSGSLIGGTCIAAIRVETGEYYNEVIPVNLFNKENFKNKSYIYYATEIINRGLQVMKVSQEEPIHICQGYIFEDSRNFLKKNNFNFIKGKIEDPLQTIIEKNFEEYTVSLGLPREFISYTKYPFHLHRILKWVYADYDKRVPLCKTGWKSWSKYSELPVQTYYDKVMKSNYTCLKCGKRIENNSSVKVMRFVIDKPNFVYLHKHC
ncbi:MAG: hypothetical protein K0Q99_104 [Clostridia bacterium]|jgi:hypothetical protein|nr:hypothetical protein [Clostridia bacterium]